MIRRIILFLVTIALLVPCFACAEQKTQQNEETGYRAVIDDGAGLLDASQYDSVLGTMMPITEYCDVGFYTYGGESKDYVLTKAKAWAKGTFGRSCTLFIIDLPTRQLAVWSTDDVMKTLTQAKAYTITDNVYGYASSGDYARCAETAFNQMNKVLRGEKVTGPMRYINNILLAVLAAILLSYLFISVRMEQEVKVSLPEIVTATAGAGAVIAAKRLTRKVRHTSSSGGGGHGGFGGGGGGGGGFSGGGGSHGF